MSAVLSVRMLLQRIDKFAPFDAAEEWDNVGLMVGSYGAAVSRVAVALDPSREAVVMSAENGCQALLCHHPLIFNPLRKLDLDAGPGLAIGEAVRRGVAVMAAHTNWDRAERGVNATLSELICLRGVEPLEGGLGAKGTLPDAEPLEPLLRRVKEAWGLSRLDCYAPPRCGALRGGVRKVALCGGSGAGLRGAAAVWGADLYITADMKYHELTDAGQEGLCVALADHGEMERASLPALAGLLSECGDVETVLLSAPALAAPMRI